MALLAAAAACAHALVPGSPSCGRAVLRRRGVRFQGPGVGSSFPAHDGGGDAPGARGALKGVILGGGSFGLAMACVLGRAGVPATLLVRSRADADYLNARGRHPKYLPDVDLPEGTRATADAAEALRGASFLVHCVPVQHSRRYLRKIAKHVPPRAAQESEIPNFKGSYLGRFPLVSADFWTSDHLSGQSRSVDAFAGTRAREHSR